MTFVCIILSVEYIFAEKIFAGAFFGELFSMRILAGGGGDAKIAKIVRTRKNFLPQLSKVFPTPPAARRELVTHDAHHSEIAFDRALDSDESLKKRRASNCLKAVDGIDEDFVSIYVSFSSFNSPTYWTDMMVVRTPATTS